VKTSGIILATAVFILIVAVFFIEVIAPSMDWSAAARPGFVENFIADRVIDGWVGRHASDQENPIAGTPENLKAGQDSYRENCAGCHGLDGSGRNQFDAEFYPPVANLTEDAGQMTDGQIYFIIAKGIRYSAMPSFEGNYNRDQIWRLVSWVRHLPHLSQGEKADLVTEMRAQLEHHKAASAAH